jgi:hypothetical protein
LRREVLYSSKTSETVSLALKEGRLNKEEIGRLNGLVKDLEMPTPSEELLFSEPFGKYRLWFTGAKDSKIPKPGEDFPEDDEEEKEPTEAELQVLESKRAERLQSRTLHLESRIAIVDARKEKAGVLIDKHNNALKQNLVPEDLENRLFDLSDEELDL